MEAEAAKDSVFDEGFVELEVPEDEAMEVASSATEQEGENNCQKEVSDRSEHG